MMKQLRRANSHGKLAASTFINEFLINRSIAVGRPRKVIRNSCLFISQILGNQHFTSYVHINGMIKNSSKSHDLDFGERKHAHLLLCVRIREGLPKSFSLILTVGKVDLMTPSTKPDLFGRSPCGNGLFPIS
jgi:hypothetical protein